MAFFLGSTEVTPMILRGFLDSCAIVDFYIQQPGCRLSIPEPCACHAAGPPYISTRKVPRLPFWASTDGCGKIWHHLPNGVPYFTRYAGCIPLGCDPQDPQWKTWAGPQASIDGSSLQIT